MVVKIRIEETCGHTVAQRVQCGKVTMKLDRRAKVFYRVFLERTLCAMVRCTSSGCVGLVTRSLSSWRIGSLGG